MKPGRDKPAMGEAFADDLDHRIRFVSGASFFFGLQQANAIPAGIKRQYVGKLNSTAIAFWNK